MLEARMQRNGVIFAEIYKINSENISETIFFSNVDSPLQFGALAYKAGHSVKPHKHKKLERCHSKFAEATFVLAGKELVSIFDNQNVFIGKFELIKNHLLITYDGYHSMQILEQFKALEFKVGPYICDDKEFI